MRVVLMFLLITEKALAHPGHGAEAGWLHLLSQPDHLALALAPAVIGLLGYLRLRRHRKSGSEPDFPERLSEGISKSGSDPDFRP